MDANLCRAVLAPAGLGEVAPSHAGKLLPPPGCSFRHLPHTKSLWWGSCQEQAVCVTVVGWPSCCHTDPLGWPSPSRCLHPHRACTCWESPFPQPVLWKTARAEHQGPAGPPQGDGALSLGPSTDSFQHRFLPPQQQDCMSQPLMQVSPPPVPPCSHSTGAVLVAVPALGVSASAGPTLFQSLASQT